MNTAQQDYIIVGAGSAGAALAARLTEDPNTRVLLVEAGRASHPTSRFPISFGLLIDNPAANWRYLSTPEPNTNNREIPVPRGKLLGGSSSTPSSPPPPTRASSATPTTTAKTRKASSKPKPPSTTAAA